jgi:hypothetical protein
MDFQKNFKVQGLPALGRVPNFRVEFAREGQATDLSSRQHCVLSQQMDLAPFQALAPTFYRLSRSSHLGYNLTHLVALLFLDRGEATRSAELYAPRL